VRSVILLLSTVVISNYTHCNPTHVELNNDIKALYARATLISKMTCAGRNEDGATMVCHAFNILDVYVYSRCRISSGNLDQITAVSHLFPIVGIIPAIKLTFNMPNNVAKVSISVFARAETNQSRETPKA